MFHIDKISLLKSKGVQNTYSEDRIEGGGILPFCLGPISLTKLTQLANYF